MAILTSIGIFILKTFMFIYDIISLPIYSLIQQPWKKGRTKHVVWAKHIKENDPYSPLMRISKCDQHTSESIKTLDQLFRESIQNYKNNKALGTREVISVNKEFDEKGKSIKKFKLGEYRWFTYCEVENRVEAISKGFLNIGFQPKRPILILAETRIEWFLSLHACMRINVPICTLYATLGEDAIAYGINELEVSTIITSPDLISKLENIIEKLPCVNQIILMEDIKPSILNKFPSRVSTFQFSEIEKIGSTIKNVTKRGPPKPNDLSLIMYTSGSTGIPKGVVFRHKNIITSVIGLCNALEDLRDLGDIYIAYLPLAHIFEMLNETLTFKMGIAIGYSSPYTLTDKSTAIMQGCTGDVTSLQPYIITAVPLMLDRIRKAINESIASKGEFMKQFFSFIVSYKYFWCEKGYNTPILNRVIFHKIKQVLGGRAKLIMSGGAPLSLDTSIFIKTCLDVKLLQCYACTETVAGGTIMSINDETFGSVGPPISTVRLKVVDWPEGGYRATDKPHPRGELAIGGENISPGYYKNEKLTEESFKEEDGIRWFYTGDIGEFQPNGTVKIIDRKKDLIKLQCGEYVALGKIESEMKTSPLVDNICVVGSDCHDYLVSIIVPNLYQLQTLANFLKKSNLSLSEMCQETIIVSAVTKQLQDYAQKCCLSRRETPVKFHICSEEWLPETGLVTAALKIKRKSVHQFYKSIIEDMFRTNNTV